MVELNEKSKEEIFREKKEAELREAKRKENEARRRNETHIKCFIGGAFKKYFLDALLFDEDEWCRGDGAFFDHRVYSVRTDIPPAVVLCALPGASCGQRCLLRSHKGDATLPPSAHTVRLPLLCTCVSGISKERICPKRKSAVPTHHYREEARVMVVKTVSSRASIIGRGARCRGKSAVEQSAYISRTTLYSEYYGEKYYPKYAEDLVSTGVMIPGHAPREYLDHSKLWNAVEKVEKHAKAQLCRLMKYSLPNWLSYEQADEMMRDYINRNFVSKGMCAEYAIHDSVNDKGERNLHIHILLTMRPILENGEWGEKSRKVYKLDKDGNKIKKKNGRYDCTTEKTTDWADKGNPKKWRQDLVETFNKKAEELGIEDERWEHRSFKERGLEAKPTIHLGEKATALERKGIHTDKGDYNREVRRLNSLIIKVQEIKRERLDKLISGAQKTATTVTQTIKNEVLELIHRAAAKKGSMSLSILKSKYFAKISNRQALTNPQMAENFIRKNGIETFTQLSEYQKSHSKTADHKDALIKSKWQRREDLKALASEYVKYSRLREVVKESRSLSGFAKMKYDKEHKAQIEAFPDAEERLMALLGEGGKATPKKWASEIAQIEEQIPTLQREYAEEVGGLATAEVIEYTKKDMERIAENERRTAERQQPQRKKQQELS